MNAIEELLRGEWVGQTTTKLAELYRRPYVPRRRPAAVQPRVVIAIGPTEAEQRIELTRRLFEFTKKYQVFAGALTVGEAKPKLLASIPPHVVETAKQLKASISRELENCHAFERKTLKEFRECVEILERTSSAIDAARDTMKTFIEALQETRANRQWSLDSDRQVYAILVDGLHQLLNVVASTMQTPAIKQAVQALLESLPQTPGNTIENVSPDRQLAAAEQNFRTLLSRRT